MLVWYWKNSRACADVPIYNGFFFLSEKEIHRLRSKRSWKLNTNRKPMNRCKNYIFDVRRDLCWSAVWKEFVSRSCEEVYVLVFVLSARGSFYSRKTPATKTHGLLSIYISLISFGVCLLGLKFKCNKLFYTFCSTGKPHIKSASNLGTAAIIPKESGFTDKWRKRNDRISVRICDQWNWAVN